MNARDAESLAEIARLCDVAAGLVARGHAWYVSDPVGVPGLAAESLIIKIGENVARVGAATRADHPEVPWSQMKRMRELLAHHYEGTDYEAVWDTLVGDLPAVRAYIVALEQD